MSVGKRPVVYAPRSVTAHGWDDDVRGWTVKRYAVSALRDSPPEAVHDLARRAVERSLPPAYPDALSFAFSVAHEDQDGCYVVVGWWSLNRVILHTRTWLAEWEDLSVIREATENATACVWELIAIGHERQAWVHHVVQPGKPDLDSYRNDMISGRF